MYHPRHLKPTHHWLAATAVLLVLVAVLAGARALQGSGPSGEETARNVAGTTTRHERAATALRECTAVRERQAAPLSAAARSLAQWKVHVGAMNQLVAGRITLAQATAFWSRTRVGADRRAQEFRTADATTKPATACRRLSGTGPAVAACARDVVRRAATLRAARTAIDTWQRHIRDMEMLRMGRMSPARATQMWLMNWRRGVRQLDAYDAAVRRSAHGPACPTS